MLRGSLLKFEAVGTADAFFAAVPTSGEVVFGAGDAGIGPSWASTRAAVQER